ncbi:MAG: tripartite tricarboxylate transporter permease [Candidatus Woesearchaeota archaeon]|jgi:putative membrane protein
MFIHIIIAIFAGICCGIFTGLAPGIHVNLVVTLLISSSAFLLAHTSSLPLCIFIIALSITHIFLEFIPSTFLGAPNSDTVLSVLPGHRYVMTGNGMMAVKLSTIGCFFGLLLGIVFLFPAMKLLPLIYPFIKQGMLGFLIIIVIAMILQNQRKIWAIVVFLLSGIAGVIVLCMPNLKDPLFPLLTGLFGTATLILSLYEENNMPEQYQTEIIDVDKKIMWKALFVGQFSSFFMSLFPGLSPAIAALFGMQISGKIGDHGYMILQGCINSAGFLMSIVTLFTIDKARNGAVVGIEELLGKITSHDIMLFVAAAAVTASIAVVITIKIGRIFCSILRKINYKVLSIGILIVLGLLSVVLSGWKGILILIVTTAIGIIPGIVKVTRTQAMGCLLLPTMIYYITF